MIFLTVNYQFEKRNQENSCVFLLGYSNSLQIQELETNQVIWTINIAYPSILGVFAKRLFVISSQKLFLCSIETGQQLKEIELGYNVHIARSDGYYVIESKWVSCVSFGKLAFAIQ